MVSWYEKSKLASRNSKRSLENSDESGVNKINKRDKRSKSYFDPIYDPTDKEPFAVKQWHILNFKRNYHAILTAENLVSQFKCFDKEVIEEAIFDTCDFDGDFSTTSPSFKNCEFDKCDFGLSYWRRARFKRCKFFRSSFSLSAFVECEFRDCTFIDIGYSGNETVLNGTVFTNPSDFIESAYLNKDPSILNKMKTTISYQSMRLDGTKASISRALLSNLAVAGEEKSYYEIVKFHQNQSLLAKISKTRYNLSLRSGLNSDLYLLGRLFLLRAEYYMMNFIGKINNWGESVSKPTLIGFAVLFIFALIYYFTGIRCSFWAAIETSVDISLLIGYTKHAAISSSAPERFVYTCNMIAGLIWYSVFVPTIIGRVSRIR